MSVEASGADTRVGIHLEEVHSVAAYCCLNFVETLTVPTIKLLLAELGGVARGL